jgi:SRSO17 transposase
LGSWRNSKIALDEIDALVKEDLPPAPVVADAGYGNITEFRDGLTERGFSYVVGVSGEVSI